MSGIEFADGDIRQHHDVELVEVVFDRTGFASTVVRDLCHDGRRIVVPGGYVREVLTAEAEREIRPLTLDELPKALGGDE